MSVWVARATTDSNDHYLFAFDYKPSTTEVIEKVWKYERAEELDWYLETTSVDIQNLQIISK